MAGMPINWVMFVAATTHSTHGTITIQYEAMSF
jgi:hypothetical protein